MRPGEVWVPRSDQNAVAAFLEGRKRAAVWAGTGSGKTVMAATWLERAMYDAFEVGRALIVAPRLVARDGWPEQLRRWAHLQHMAADSRLLTFDDLDLTPSTVLSPRKLAKAPAHVLQKLVEAKADEMKPHELVAVALSGELGVSVEDLQALMGPGALQFRDRPATKRRLQSLKERIHIVSWDAFPWVVRAYGRNFPYQALIPDESSFLRDQDSARSRAAWHVVGRLKGVTHVLELTASPRANDDEAVWFPLELLAPGLLGETLTQFRDTWCVPDTVNKHTGKVYRWKVAGALRSAFTAKCAEVAVSVPENLGIDVVHAPVRLPLPDEVRAAYREMANTDVTDGGRVTAGSAGVRHNKLRQLSSGFVYRDDGTTWALSGFKMDRLEEMLESIGGQVLVAFSFDQEAEELKRRFGKRFADIRKTGAKDAFLAGDLQVLGVHPASAGHGVDGLQTQTNHIIWTTVPEDRELFDQTNGRLKRPGQDQASVVVHALVAADTREEEIWDEVLPGKARIQDLLLRACRV